MDWSRIKTIFIVSFLILDLYLMYQFLLIRDANKYEFISEVTLEDKLKTDEIDFGQIPKSIVKDKYLSAKPKQFLEEELSKLSGQSITLIDKTVVQSVLDKPVLLTNKIDPLEAQNFIRNQLLYGNDYEYWSYNELTKTITFFQKYDNKIFYENINGKVTLYLNNEFQIVSYEQTYLEGIENLTDKEEVLPPIKAIESLYQKGMLKPKSKVTRMELGYSTLVQLAASQVLAPTWHFVIDDEEHLYVNAFEGQIIQFNNDENNVVE